LEGLLDLDAEVADGASTLARHALQAGPVWSKSHDEEGDYATITAELRLPTVGWTTYPGRGGQGLPQEGNRIAQGS
jgi:hypothetical protein